ncbi:MAG TPA: AraC family transcriptional regulator [Pyrinomonadaceae bacterium]
MRKSSKREDIRIWRNAELPGVEFRSGVAVSEPYPRHWHDEYQLCLITDGGGWLQYRGARHVTPTAGLFIVHPGEVHSNETTTGCSFQSIYIQPESVTKLASEIGTVQDGLPFFQDTIIFDNEIISDYRELQLASAGSSSTLERESLLRSLLLNLISRRSKSRPALKRCRTEPFAVRRIRDYIIENHERGISLADLEQLVGLSPFHLTRVFTNAVGMPPHAFQTHVRIAVAKTLIRRGQTFADAASTVGFADQSHFHRHFRRLMKVTPGEYFKDSKNVQY